MRLTPGQYAIVALGNLGGVVAAIVGFLLLDSAFAPAQDALTLALQLIAVPGGLVLLLVILVMVVRGLTGAFNPLDDPEPRLYRKSQRVLTNTVEQTAAFVPLLLALGASLPAAESATLPALTIVFAVSRILYAVGYLIHPMGRGFGMSATVTVSAGIAAFLVWHAAT